MSHQFPTEAAPATSTKPVTTRIVRGWDGFRATEPHWRRLFEMTRGVDPQSVWPLVALEAELHSNDYQPFLVTAFQNGELCAIAPFLEPKRKLLHSKKTVKQVGLESAEFGMSIVASDAKITWAGIELELRDWLSKSRFESIVLRRHASHLASGAYVTDFVGTKQLRKVRPHGKEISLVQDLALSLTEQAKAWMPTFENCQVRYATHDEIGDAERLLKRFAGSTNPLRIKESLELVEEGDGFIAWLEQDSNVVAVQSYIQTQDCLATLAGGGSGLAMLQLRVFQTAQDQGVEKIRLLSPTSDWNTVEAGLLEEVVIARI